MRLPSGRILEGTEMRDDLPSLRRCLALKAVSGTYPLSLALILALLCIKIPGQLRPAFRTLDGKRRGRVRRSFVKANVDDS